jgi:hypothetical protein
MSPDSFSNKESCDLNSGGHMLDLPIRIRLYVGSRLHDKGKKIRNYTLFFRPDRILPANGFIRKKVKPIPTEENAQLIKQPISLKEREKRRRR